MDAQSGVVAAAASYEIDGEQYIAVEAGYGLARYGMSNGSRLLVFKLGGAIQLRLAPPPTSTGPGTGSADVDGQQRTDRTGPPAVRRSLHDVS